MIVYISNVCLKHSKVEIECNAQICIHIRKNRIHIHVHINILHIYVLNCRLWIFFLLFMFCSEKWKVGKKKFFSLFYKLLNYSVYFKWFDIYKYYSMFTAKYSSGFLYACSASSISKRMVIVLKTFKKKMLKFSHQSSCMNMNVGILQDLFDIHFKVSTWVR